MESISSSASVLWLEDRERTISLHRKIVERNCISLLVVGTPKEFMTILEEHEAIGKGKTRTGLIIDIMMFGVRDLREFGINDADTKDGIHAGYVFADRVLRAKESKYRDLPLCLLTERDIDDELRRDIEHLQKKGGGQVFVVQKLRDADLASFKKFLELI